MAKWKPFDLTWGRSIYACSACEEAIEVPTCNGEPLYNFCPMCGARMDTADTPQTERMTEEEIDTMLAKALVGQTDCGWGEPK